MDNADNRRRRVNIITSIVLLAWGCILFGVFALSPRLSRYVELRQFGLTTTARVEKLYTETIHGRPYRFVDITFVAQNATGQTEQRSTTIRLTPYELNELKFAESLTVRYSSRRPTVVNIGGNGFPTVLVLIVCALLAGLICYCHALWRLNTMEITIQADQ